MEDFLGQLLMRTPETEFVFNLFHGLLASLMLLSGVRLAQAGEEGGRWSLPDKLLTLAAGLFIVGFASQGLAAGSFLYLDVPRPLKPLVLLGDAAFIAGCVLAASSLIERPTTRFLRRVGMGAVSLFAVLTFIRGGSPLSGVGDTAAVAAVAAVFLSIVRRRDVASVRVVAGGTLLLAVSLRWGGPQSTEAWSALLWHLERHLVSISLFVFSWMLGERSVRFFDRVFVRLNLTLIILASVVILCNVGLDRFQYLEIAEERSLPLAEYLRGHVVYFGDQGVDLETIVEDPNVMRRVVIGFGELPDVRKIEIFDRGEAANFRYRPDKTIDYSIDRADAEDGTLEPERPADTETGLALHRLIRLPLDGGDDARGHVAFFSTLASLNQHIRRGIILIYVVFTATAVLGVIAVGFIVRSADLTIQANHRELETTQQQLAQAAKLASLGELAAGVAHEINNPVTSVLSTASHMARKSRATDLTESDRKQLDLISSQAQRISGIVNNLLTFSRRSRMEMSACDLKELAATAFKLTSFRLRDDSVEVRADYAANLPEVQADRERLIEVLVNLVNNALDAMPEGGVLSIRTFISRDESVCVSVSDTGVGMSPEVCSRVFDPFFTTKEAGKGTGLGLSISHGIMEDHGGEIRVYSQAGGGSTFSLVFFPGGRKSA